MFFSSFLMHFGEPLWNSRRIHRAGTPNLTKPYEFSMKMYTCSSLCGEMRFPTGHFPHGRFIPWSIHSQTDYSPRSSKRLPEGAKSETPLGRFAPRNVKIKLLCMFSDKFCILEPQTLPGHINFRWNRMHRRHSQAKLILPRAIFRNLTRTSDFPELDGF